MQRAALLSLALILAACGGGDDAAAPAAPTAPASTQAAQMTPVERGAVLWKRCRACHNIEAGARHKVGPNLHGVFGMTAGTQEGFNYSKAMAASGIVWDDATMDAYLADPRGYIPGNRMSYIGLKKAEDREAIIAWMREESAS